MAEEEKDEKASQTADLFVAQAEKTNKLLEELVAQSKQPAASAKAEPEKAKPQRYTRAQLRAAVDSGQITQEVMDSTLELQLRADLEAEMERKLAAATQASTVTSKIQSRIDEYTGRIPNILVQGSDEWKAADKAYRQLIDDGQDEGLKTALAALRIAFPEGSAQKQEVRETTTERTRKAEVNVTSGARKQGGTRKDPLAGLSEEQRSYIEARIANGRFKGPDDPGIQKLIASHQERLEGRRMRFGRT